MSRLPEGDATGFAQEVARACQRRNGIVASEVYLKESRYRRTERIGSGTGTAAPAGTQAEETGLALRLFRAEGRAGHAWAPDPTDAGTLEIAAAAAAKLAERASPGAADLPPGPWEPPDLDLYDPAVEQEEPVASLLARIEAAILEEGRGEVEVESLACIAGGSRVTLATSAGFAASYRSTLMTLILALRARRGAESVFDRSVIAARHLSMLDADRLGREAVRRARLPLEGAALPPGPVRVALEPRVAALLVEHLAASLVEGAVERGRSALPAAAPKESVGSGAITLVEDASLARGLASAPFDGEARPTRPWTLIERGTLRHLLGARAGRGGERVGSASRTSFTEPPRREPANLHLARGERGPRALVAEAGSVFRVTGASLLGRGGPASGEVVLAASGERLESGAFVEGVRGVTLVGRLRDILAGVLEAGNDLSFHLRGSVVGSPTLLIDGMWVA